MESVSQTSLVLVRHGESRMNVTQTLSGQLEPNPLTDLGRNQARELAQRLNPLQSFSVIYSSDLERGFETAQIIAEELGGAIVITDPNLRNRNFGHLQGMQLDQVREKLRPAQEVYDKLDDSGKYKFRFTDGMETDEELMTRFTSFLKRILAENEEKSMLVVSHHSLMRTFLIDQGWATYSELPLGSLSNTASVRIKLNGEKFEIEDVTGISKQEASGSTAIL